MSTTSWRRRLTTLECQMGGSPSPQALVRPTSCSANANYNASVRSVAGQLFLEFNAGPDYANYAAYYGPTPDRDAIVASETLLFRGFTDGMPNVMLVPDPYEGKQRVYIVMMPASLKPTVRGKQQQSPSPFSDVFAESILPHASLANFRDMGGTEVAPDPITGERRSLRWGSIFRHGDISDEGSTLRSPDLDRGAAMEYIRTLHIRTNVDLREADDFAGSPQVWPAGGATTSVSIPITLRAMASAGEVASAADAALLWHMDASVQFVKDRSSLAGIKEALGWIMEPANHPVSFNCLAGRDRTGWVAAVLLMILGASREVIIADYLRSNDPAARGGSLEERVLAMVRSHFEKEGTAATKDQASAEMEYSAAVDAMLTLKEEYITLSLDTVEAEFGGFEGYLAALGVTQDARSRFKSFMLI